MRVPYTELVPVPSVSVISVISKRYTELVHGTDFGLIWTSMLIAITITILFVILQ